jgi:hypothetical protein
MHELAPCYITDPNNISEADETKCFGKPHAFYRDFSAMMKTIKDQ